MSDHTPGPWNFTIFTKPDGAPIETPLDVAEALAHSAIVSGLGELWGVSIDVESGVLVICYTGNGPTSKANARLIAAAPDLLEACVALQSEAAARGCGLRIADEAIEKAKSI
jgi:hypothetical protein